MGASPSHWRWMLTARRSVDESSILSSQLPSLTGEDRSSKRLDPTRRSSGLARKSRRGVARYIFGPDETRMEFLE